MDHGDSDEFNDHGEYGKIEDLDDSREYVFHIIIFTQTISSLVCAWNQLKKYLFRDGSGLLFLVRKVVSFENYAKGGGGEVA